MSTIHIIRIKQFADNRQWNKLTPVDWEFLARINYSIMIVEEVQLIAVGKSSKVFNHLSNPSERVRRLHAVKWKL